MKSQFIHLLLPAGLAAASQEPLHARHHARSLLRAREVPQEHSHNIFLDLVRASLAINNPLEIQDPVFGLLGNAAAAAGAGKVTNLDCLQQETANQAFSNAKEAGDIPGMAGALVYRTLERNTGSVGQASILCDETAANPEIAALSQHQDPASSGAAEINREIELALAVELAAVGADPNLALESGTFAPGTIGDPTGKGNTCDTVDDEPGCAFTENLIVPAVSEEDISSAVAGITPTVAGTGVILATDINLAGLSLAAGAGNAAVTDVNAAAGGAAATATAGEGAESACAATGGAGAAPAETGAANAVSAATPASGASGSNVQTFTGTLGGPAPPVISTAGAARPFTVGKDTFVNAGAALQRSCAQQQNKCADAANSGALDGGVGQCVAQEKSCNAAGSGAAKRTTRRNGATSRRQAGGDFGICSDPTILFEEGLDGRNTPAFIAENQVDFNHGSALNIAVIAGFICQRLDSTCKAGADVVASCSSASAAAVATTQNQAAADVFNSALGASAAVATPCA